MEAEMKNMQIDNGKQFNNNVQYGNGPEIENFYPSEDNLHVKNQLSSFGKYFHLFNNIFLLICITEFILNIFSIDKMNKNSDFFQGVSQNWNLPLIKDFNLVCADNSKLISNVWRGTTNGCLCSTNLNRGVCNSKTEKSCQQISSIDPVDYSLWRSSSICKTISPGNYFDLTLTDRADNCPTGYKSCGRIDSKNNYLCILNAQVCPINNMIFSPNPLTNNTYQKSLNLGNGFLYYSALENGNTIIPIEFRVESNKPCLDPQYSYFDFDLYILDYFYNNKNCLSYSTDSNLIYDENYVQLDEYPMNNLYSENRILNKLQTLPNFSLNFYTNKNVKLYSKNYYGLNLNCFNVIKNDKQTFLNELNNFSANNDLNIWNIFSLIFSAITVILGITFYSIGCCCMCSVFNKSRFKIVHQMYINSIIAFLVILSIPIIIDFIFGILTLGNQKSYLFVDKFFIDSNCVDANLLSLYSAMTKDYNVGKSCKIVTVILLGFIWFILFSFTMRVYYKLKDMKRDTEIE